MDFYNVGKEDMDGVVDQLRLTKGTECAIFLYETGDLEFKVSLRSKDRVDVSKIAVTFGGGGHKRAAGFDIEGDKDAVIEKVLAEIEKEF